MAIPEKNENECSQIKLNLCGDIKKAVIGKRDEIRSKGMNCSKELAVQKIIKDWIEIKKQIDLL